jgi:hypothetical protein
MKLMATAHVAPGFSVAPQPFVAMWNELDDPGR